MDFSDIIVQVERRLYHCKVPTWLIRLVKHRERRPGPQRGGVCRPYDGDGGGNKRILNPNQKAECKLSDGEQFKYLFHRGNIKSLEKP